MDSVFFIDMAISIFLRFLREKLNTGDQKSKWKRAILKVFKQIVVVFGDDAEFQDAFKNKGK